MKALAIACTYLLMAGLCLAEQATENRENWIFLLNADTGYSVELGWGKKEAGAVIFQQVLDWSEQHQWLIEPAGGDYGRLRNRVSGHYLALDAAGNAVQAAKADDPLQLWRVERSVDGISTRACGGSAMRLRSAATGLYLQPPGKSGAVVRLAGLPAGGSDTWISLPAWHPMDPSPTEIFLSNLGGFSFLPAIAAQYGITLLKNLNRWEAVLEQAAKQSRDSFEAMLALGNRALAAERFDDAISWYSRILDENKDPKLPWPVKDYLALATGRKAQGAVNPVTRFKTLMVFIGNANIEGKQRQLYAPTIDRMKLSVELENQFLILASGGRVSLTWKEAFLPLTMTALQRDRMTPVFSTMNNSQSSGQFDFERFVNSTQADYEAYFWFWPGKDIIFAASGGGMSFGLAGDRIKTPYRGFVQISDGWYQSENVFPIIMHEFFHVVETVASLPKSHGFTAENRAAYPQWKGEGEFEYQLWQFKTNPTLVDPKRWEKFRDAPAYSEKLSEEEFGYFSRFSVADRNKAHVFLEEADVLFNEGKLDAAAASYRRVLEIYPAWERAWNRAPATEPLWIFEGTNPLPIGGLKKDLPALAGAGNSLSVAVRFLVNISLQDGKTERLAGFEDRNEGKSGANDRTLSILPDGRLQFYVWPFKQFSLTSANGYADGKPHLAVGTYDRGTVELWIDGTLAASGKTGESLYAYPGYWTTRGSRSLLRLAVWNRALSAKEITGMR